MQLRKERLARAEENRRRQSEVVAEANAQLARDKVSPSSSSTTTPRQRRLSQSQPSMKIQETPKEQQQQHQRTPDPEQRRLSGAKITPPPAHGGPQSGRSNGSSPSAGNAQGAESARPNFSRGAPLSPDGDAEEIRVARPPNTTSSRDRVAAASRPGRSGELAGEQGRGPHHTPQPPAQPRLHEDGDGSSGGVRAGEHSGASRRRVGSASQGRSPQSGALPPPQRASYPASGSARGNPGRSGELSGRATHSASDGPLPPVPPTAAYPVSSGARTPAEPSTRREYPVR